MMFRCKFCSKDSDADSKDDKHRYILECIYCGMINRFWILPYSGSDEQLNYLGELQEERPAPMIISRCF